MAAETRQLLRRLIAAGSLAAVATFGVAACDDGVIEGMGEPGEQNEDESGEEQDDAEEEGESTTEEGDEGGEEEEGKRRP